jgi:hypothetical protein
VAAGGDGVLLPPAADERDTPTTGAMNVPTVRPGVLDPLRLLDPGRVRLRTAARTLLAVVGALAASAAASDAAGLPGGFVVIAAVVAVTISRSLHGTSLAHRLSALLYVPAVGVLAGLVGRFMLHHLWWGSATYVAAVAASRYLMRFGGRVRALGRLALSPLLAVMIVPIPPSAAKAVGPLWGAAAAAIAVGCVLLARAALPPRPAREAATAAVDAVRAARRLHALPAARRAHARTSAALHRAALTTEDRLAALSLRPGPAAGHAPTLAGGPPAPPDAVAGAGAEPAPPPAAAALSAAVFQAEVLAYETPPANAPGDLPGALHQVVLAAAAVRTLPAREAPAHDPPRPPARKGVQPHTRLTAQLAAAMAAAFAAGHLAFAHHWTWTVITAFVVCSGARSRGDVVHRSGLRVTGAFAGAVTGTLVAHLVAAEPLAAVAVILGYLFVGTWLRDVTYAAWAFCVTSLLAVLYSLNGEHGTGGLLLQRPEGILLGSACGILAAYFVLPLRTQTVMRARAARTLQALQDLLTAARAPDPDRAALRRLARDADRACRELDTAAAAVRAHRALLGPRRGRGTAGHAADWADALALCVRRARALAAAPPEDLATARPALALTARNLGHVRRRLGRRPDAEAPRPLPETSPPRPLDTTLRALDAALAALFRRLPA